MGLQKKVKAPELPEYAADMTPFRVYICGPTDFTNYRFLERYCDRALSNKDVIIVIHDDGKTGVANLAAVYAESRYYETEIASPNMQCDAVIAYRDSKYHTKAIRDAKAKGIPVKVIRY